MMMTNDHLLLDTCAVIWIADGKPIANLARDAIAQALEASEPVFISPISAWEIGLLASSGRLSLRISPIRWFEQAIGSPGIYLAALRPDVLIASSALPGAPPNDPADRIIVTTAREHGYRLVTRDRKLLAYAEQGYCRALAC